MPDEDHATCDPAFLANGEMPLEAILKDPAEQSVHDEAGSLLGLVRYRLHPEQRVTGLGKLLADGIPVPPSTAPPPHPGAAQTRQ